MRILPLAVLAALATPVPALAQDDGTADHEGLARVAKAMSDPATQAQVSAVAGSLVDALMDMPVAPLLRAAEALPGGEPRDIDPDATIADLAGPDVGVRGQDVSARVPQMMQTLAAMTYALDGVLPQLRDAMENAAREAGERTVRESAD